MLELVVKFLTNRDSNRVSIVRGLATNTCEKMFKIQVVLVAN